LGKQLNRHQYKWVKSGGREQWLQAIMLSLVIVVSLLSQQDVMLETLLLSHSSRQALNSKRQAAMLSHGSRQALNSKRQAAMLETLLLSHGSRQALNSKRQAFSAFSVSIFPSTLSLFAIKPQPTSKAGKCDNNHVKSPLSKS